MNEFKKLFKKIDVNFAFFSTHKKLFIEAFTHRSSVNESSENTHNERLEFLGDAVLELVTTEFLFTEFADKPEGELTNMRSALVKKENLAVVARKLNLGKLLIMSRGEERSGGREKDYLLANLVEAFIGALYQAGKYQTSEKFIKNFVLVELDNILKNNLHVDAKSEFQELTQGELGITPEYKTLADFGKDHEKVFEMAVVLNGIKVGTGKGGSKKEAQLMAAADALAKKNDWFADFPKK
jgi:ribonuclease-3